MEKRYYEDIEIGEKYESPGRTITEADIVNFAGISGDFNALHMDKELMKNSPFKGRIAHGLLGLAVQSGLAIQARTVPTATIAFLGIESWSFVKPILIGDTLKVKLEVVDKKETKKGDRGIYTMERVVVNQNGEVVQKGRSTHMVEKRNKK